MMRAFATHLPLTNDAPCFFADVPESCFDDELEIEREFADIANSLSEGGLEKLTSVKSSSVIPDRGSYGSLLVDEKGPVEYRSDAEIENSLSGSLAQDLIAHDLTDHRHGANPELRCHLIDLDEVTYVDVLTLRKYLSDDAEIMGRKATNLCAKCQRKVAKTIKTARNFGLLPHLGEFVLRDARPSSKKKRFHDASPGGAHIDSMTIL
ncbi:ribosomal protein S18-domain-containing protein [Ochromonadaceae sp. CCMP2298]|nr:ribosomal protein S18-domain-containing protein [Ochromonadaceae sp. CCMP2298]